MRNLRVYSMSAAEQKAFDPVAFTAALKAAGFEFDSESCPVKIKKPWDAVVSPDGTKVWRQWDAQ